MLFVYVIANTTLHQNHWVIYSQPQISPSEFPQNSPSEFPNDLPKDTVDKSGDNKLSDGSQGKSHNSDNLKFVGKSKNRKQSVHTKKRLRILLVTNYRSGSSFVGELLKNHEDMFYSFEPLYLANPPNNKLRVTKRVKKCYNDTASYLEDLLFKCNMTALEHDSRLLLQSTERKKWIHLSFPGSDTFHQAHNECPRKRHTAAKVIRQSLLKDVIPRFTDKGAIVLYLIRDPRGITSSRIKINLSRFRSYKTHSQEALYIQNIGNLCDNLSENLEYLKSHTLDGDFKWKDNVVVLRYEDFAYNPMQMTQRLYNFLGIDLSPSVAAFIERSTHVDRKGGGSPYGVRRDSAKTAENWRTYLSFSYVDKVQSVCRRTLEDFGYANVTSDSIKVIDRSVLMPMPQQVPHL